MLTVAWGERTISELGIKVVDMVGFFRKQSHSGSSILRGFGRCGPIGINIGDDTITMAQLANNGKGLSLIAGGSEGQPSAIIPGSADWQRWAIQAICQLTGQGSFRGKDAVAAMPASELFIDHMRMPRVKEGSGNGNQVCEAIAARIKPKVGFDVGEAMIRYLPAEENNVVVIAVQRKIIDRHLAIYEEAGLNIKSMGVWPLALIGSYVSFFGRRRTDVETVVMLVQIDTERTNMVVCRHRNLLFARSMPIGSKHLDNQETITRLVLELTACKRQFVSMYKNARIKRLIFLARQAQSDNGVCAAIAKQLEMPAQIGDCLAAVKIAHPVSSGVDRRDSQINWSAAFGLGLS